MISSKPAEEAVMAVLLATISSDVASRTIGSALVSTWGTSGVPELLLSLARLRFLKDAPSAIDFFVNGSSAEKGAVRFLKDAPSAIEFFVNGSSAEKGAGLF